MNFIDGSDKSNDYQRLMNLCNSYGLNHQQTCQILSEFRNGNLKNDIKQNTNSQSYSSKRQQEEYSFKYNNEIESVREQQQMEQQEQDVVDDMQQYMMNRIKFEKQVYLQLKNSNEALKQQLDKKQNTIRHFMNNKDKDSSIILGLKDIISDLTKQLQQKDSKYEQLQQKYLSLLPQNHFQSKQNLKPLIQNCQISRKSRQQCQSPLQTNNSVLKLKKVQSNSKIKQTKEPFQRNNRIDIGKYKGMIEDLRNSYQKVKQ